MNMHFLEVIEDCRLLITIPTGLVPGDEERNFVVYVNDFVDEISVLIYNRWGELIYHCIEEMFQKIPHFANGMDLSMAKRSP
ncbi:hypothetical protein QWY93_18885 [Echinicola jeungdonensis]|uniref:hypothetical protein n=1 Tax=Echinicola jeungdonensis TaxID=709343 RepID=UPI0025B2F2B1|nr:hypothetical protein [Echinicola jeungdonensis]MDN3671336.1 hypothetical protein [Echinicola jeungdonensis]